MKATKTNIALSELFDVDPSTGEIFDVVPTDNSKRLPSDPRKENLKLEDDFELARSMMHSLLLKGANSLDNALLVANGTEDPKAFDAVSKLISNLTDVSEKLIELHGRKVRSKAATPSDGKPIEAGSTNITGPVFVGSTSELALMITKDRQINRDN